MHRTFGINLLLNTFGCGVFGITLLEATRPAGFVSTFFAALGIAAGFTLAVAMFAALRAAPDETKVPAPFPVRPIMLILIGLTTLAFMGLQGIAG